MAAHGVTVDEGTTLMEAGQDNNIGLEGTCGGSLSCATCHVIFSAEDYARVGEPSDDEMDMLDLARGDANFQIGMPDQNE